MPSTIINDAGKGFQEVVIGLPPRADRGIHQGGGEGLHKLRRGVLHRIARVRLPGIPDGQSAGQDQGHPQPDNMGMGADDASVLPPPASQRLGAEHRRGAGMAIRIRPGLHRRRDRQAQRHEVVPRRLHGPDQPLRELPPAVHLRRDRGVEDGRMPLVRHPPAGGLHSLGSGRGAWMRAHNAHAHAVPQGQAAGDRRVEHGDRGGGDRRMVPEDDDLQPPDLHQHDGPDRGVRDHRPDVALRPAVRGGVRAGMRVQVRGPLQKAGPTSPDRLQTPSDRFRDVLGDLRLLVPV